MSFILDILRYPGARKSVEFSAPTQASASTKKLEDDGEQVTTLTVYKPIVKPRLLDRILDRTVQLSGSEFVYFAFLIALVAWALLGIKFGQSATWAIIISDVQAITNMVFDAFLMRQQFNDHDNMLMVAASLRSRAVSHKRMLHQLIDGTTYHQIDAAALHKLSEQTESAVLPKADLLTRISTTVSNCLGHIVTVIGFWVCIAVWLAFGPYCGWSERWQLYINSATSALMVFMLAFIANVRERHADYSREYIRAIWEADANLESQLRTLTKDTQENPIIALPPRQRSGVQRAIDYYADLVGTLAGIAILALVLIAWIACGPALEFNASWWLLIGTYAGLVGLNDGFVLRNISDVLEAHEDAQFDQVEQDDHRILEEICATQRGEKAAAPHSFPVRLSIRMGAFCSSQWTVVTGLVFTVGLIVGASVMRWDVTGQLLCNIPPSIIESFFTMALITGHNVQNAKRNATLTRAYERRLELLAYLGSQKEASKA